MKKNEKLNKILKMMFAEDESVSIELEVLKLRFIKISKQHCREETIIFYKNQLKQIFNYFKEHNIKYIEDINIDVILDYRALRIKRNNNNNTINKHVSSLQSVLKNGVRDGLIESNPIATLKPLPEEEEKLRTIDKTYVDMVMKHLDEYDQSLIQTRYKLIIYLFKTTGIRISELVKIQKSNIDIINKRILLTFTKNKRNRFLFLENKTIDILIYFLSIDTKNKSDYLFNLFKHNRIISKKTIYKHISNLKIKIGIPKRISITPHCWRHTFAVTLLERGCSIRFIQDFLGHVNISSTMIYTKLNTEQLQFQFDKFQNET